MFINHTLTFVFLLLVFDVSAQSKADQLKSIPAEFSSINNDKGFTKKTLDLEEVLGNTPDGGAELSGFYKHGKIKKILQWIGLSSGIEIKEFYFKNDRLILVYWQFRSFLYNEEKEELNHSKTRITFERRYYFSNNKLIDQKSAGPPSQEKDVSSLLLKEAAENVKLLRSKSAF